MQFIKNFKKMFDPSMQLVILIVSLLFVVYKSFSISVFSIGVILSLIMLLLMLAGFVILLMNKKLFAAHVGILVLYFSGAATAFFNSIFSLRFSPFGLLSPLTGQIIVEFIIFAYLILMIASYIINGGLQTNKVQGKVALLIMAFIAYLLLFVGFNSTILYTILLGTIFLFGDKKAVLLMIMGYLIFNFYSNINAMFSLFVVTSLVKALIIGGFLLMTIRISLDEFQKTESQR